MNKFRILERMLEIVKHSDGKQCVKYLKGAGMRKSCLSGW